MMLWLFLAVALAQHDDQNHYRVLGVSPSASLADIKAAFRKRAREKHPDKTRGRGRCASRINDEFSKLSTAYDVLRSPESRRAYDLSRPIWITTILHDLVSDARNQLTKFTESLRWGFGWWFRRRHFDFGTPKSQRAALNDAEDVVVVALQPKDHDLTVYRHLCSDEDCWVIDCTGFVVVSRCWRLPLGYTAFYVDKRKARHRIDHLLRNDTTTSPRLRSTPRVVETARRFIAQRRYEAMPLKALIAHLRSRHRKSCKPHCIDKHDLLNFILSLEFPTVSSS